MKITATTLLAIVALVLSSFYEAPEFVRIILAVLVMFLLNWHRGRKVTAEDLSRALPFGHIYWMNDKALGDTADKLNKILDL